MSQETETEVENDLSIWTDFKISKELLKDIRLSITPEIRFNDLFYVDELLVETELRYKPLKYLAFAGSYRLTANLKDEKETEYIHRFAFDVTAGTELMRFEPEFRIRYSNYTDSDKDEEGNKFLRYKVSTGYDIPHSKVTPFAGIEMFHLLNDNKIRKMRYEIGAEYKLSKKNRIGLSYRLDYYITKYKNNHIIGLSYKLKL